MTNKINQRVNGQTTSDDLHPHRLPADHFCEESGMKTDAEKVSGLIARIFDAYPECYIRIVQVNKEKAWESVEDHFCGIVIGWEKEIGSLFYYVVNGFRGVGIEALDVAGLPVAKCADFYI